MKWQWIMFVIGTAACWGAYVPMLHEGQNAIGATKGPLRAFLCVGVAYFAVAVPIPLIVMSTGVEPFEFKPRGLVFAIVAGVLGAAGALGIIFALKTGGKPIYVAPLVFGIAPIVNVIITMIWHRPKTAPSPMFFVGIVLAAVGAGLVLLYKPTDAIIPQ